MIRILAVLLLVLLTSQLGVCQESLLLKPKKVITDNDEILIGSISGVAVDSNRDLYIFDFTQNAVLKVDEEGNYVGKVINSGRGPGEINSIYSYYLDANTEEILVSDRQNYRYMVTNLQGKELRSYPIRPSEGNPAMNIVKYTDEVYALMYYNSVGQSARKVEGIDSLIHFYDRESFQRLYSIADRSSFNKIVGYDYEAAELINRTHVGEVVFINQDILLVSPYIFNKGVIVYEKNSEFNWIYAKTINSPNWEVEPFQEIDFKNYRENREEYRSKGRNILTSSSQDGRGAGIVNLRSIGIYNTSDYIVNFIVKETSESGDFFHHLYAERYNYDLEYVGKDKIYVGEANELIMFVSWMDDDENFYLTKEPARNKTEIVKFQLAESDR